MTGPFLVSYPGFGQQAPHARRPYPPQRTPPLKPGASVAGLLATERTATACTQRDLHRSLEHARFEAQRLFDEPLHAPADGAARRAPAVMTTICTVVVRT